MNYGGDAADQIVRYSLDGAERSLRITGSVAKNMAILIAAMLKENRKTHGKTRLGQMLKDPKTMKFFAIPNDRLKEFAHAAKLRGLLYVIIKDKKNPEFAEIMVYAEDATKVNRVLDKMNLEFVKAEVGAAIPEQMEKDDTMDAGETQGKENAGQELTKSNKKTEKVIMPEGTIEFELDEDLFNVGEVSVDGRNFTQAQEEKNPSEVFLRNNVISSKQENNRDGKKSSVRAELKSIQKDRNKRLRKQQNPNRVRTNTRNKTKKKLKMKGR